MKQYGALDDTIYLWFAANDTSGSGGDGASPAADVRLAGAAVDTAPVYSPTPSLLSHTNYPAGAYEIAITASAANGFATGNTYAVFCTLAIDSQNPTGFIGSFDLKPVESNLIQIGDVEQSATDLKDFVDTGYDPNTNKITGCVLVDTTTANSDMVGEAPTVIAIRQEMDTNSTKMAPSQVLTDYKATGFNTVVPDTAGTAPTDAEIADAVWDELKAGHVIADSFGDYLDDEITSRNATAPPTVIQIRQEMDTNSTKMAPSQVLADYKATGFNTVVPDVAGTAPTDTEIADAVWDELKSSHTIADSFGDYLDDEITSRNATIPPTAIAIRQEMDTNSTKMAPSQALADYKATGFATANEYDTVITALQTDITFIKNEAGGKWEIIDNQMIFYKESGTELMRFNLFDTSGNPAITDICKRVRV